MSLLVAEQFANLIDAQRFEDAAQLLAEDCKYQYSEGKYQGRESIINIYRINALQSKKVFDEVVYTSTVEALDDGSLKIHFVDKIRMGHRWHEYRSHQVVTCSDAFILTIRHVDTPDEMAALRLFMSNATASPPSATP